MTDPPRRFKERSELTIDEELATIQAERRGDAPPRFETIEYQRARREHLKAGGFEYEDGDPEPKPIEELSPDEHFQRIRKP
jgi:hypothetical protein